MSPFPTGPVSARTGAISVTAVLSATGLLATPAHAATPQHLDLAEAAPMTASLSLNPASIERALAPAAAPVVISKAAHASASTHVTHTVVRGDTVWDLARHYGSTVTAIIDANGLDSRATIHLGERLVIPGGTHGAKATRQGHQSLHQDRYPHREARRHGLGPRHSTTRRQPRPSSRPIASDTTQLSASASG